MDGWIKMHRKIINNKIYQNSHLLHLAVHLLLKASHKEHEMLVGYTPVLLKKGQLITGERALARDLGGKPSAWRRRLLVLESMRFCKRESKQAYTLITVINYNLYQNNESESEALKQAQNEAQSKQRVSTDQAESKTNKNDNNGKNEKNTTGSEAKVLLDYFFTQYQKKHNTKYVVNGAKDITLLKTLLQTLTAVELKECIDKFFVSTDQFINKSDYGIGVFKSQVNKLKLEQKEIQVYREFNPNAH